MSTTIMTESRRHGDNIPPAVYGRGRPRRGEARPVPPCACCGTKGGALNAGGRPFRTSGERFGLDGMVCNRCRMALASRGALYGPEPDEPAEGSFDRRIAFAMDAHGAGFPVGLAMDALDALERGGAA